MSNFFWRLAQRQAVTTRKKKKHSSGLVLRRAAFVARFIYWSIKHRSTKHAAWVAAYEGYSWN